MEGERGILCERAATEQKRGVREREVNGDLCDLEKEQEERAVEGSDQGRKWIGVM